MIKIEQYNDAKKKSESFECIIDLQSFNADGYGENTKESVDNLKNNIERLIKELSSINYEELYKFDG